jgi:cardiolipin synthase
MPDLLSWAREAWPFLASVVYVAGAAWVTVDAVLRKRHGPAIVAWVGLAWLAPITGAIAYFLLGINRIQRSANALDRPGVRGADGAVPSALPAAVDPALPGLAGLARLGAVVTRRPLLEGNRVEPLVDGDEAFPAMLAAIEAAERSVTLASYIFDNDLAGDATAASRSGC